MLAIDVPAFNTHEITDCTVLSKIIEKVVTCIVSYARIRWSHLARDFVVCLASGKIVLGLDHQLFIYGYG